MKRYTDEQVADGSATLRAMPKRAKQKPLYTKQAAVKAMVKDIVAAQKRGYSLEEIARALKSADFSMSTATLKSYVQRAKSSKIDDHTAHRDGLLG